MNQSTRTRKKKIINSVPLHQSHSVKTRRQEPHRVYIQKRQADNNFIISNSTAIRFTDSTNASDITNLIRSKIGLTSQTNFNLDTVNYSTRYNDHDKLILVGTIIGLPTSVINFDHEKYQTKPISKSADDDNEENGHEPQLEPINIVRTLLPNENPLIIRDEMVKHLWHRQMLFEEKLPAHIKKQNIQTILMWFFQPSQVASKVNNEFLSYIDLNGYCSGIESSSSVASDDDSTESDSNSMREDASSIIKFWNDEDYGFSYLLKLPTSMKHNYSNRYAKGLIKSHALPFSKERYFKDRFDQALEHLHSQPLQNRFLFKRSRTDPNIWKKSYCVLTHEELWFISRVATRSNNVKQAKYRPISLSNALLKANSDSVPFRVELCTARGDIHEFRTLTESDHSLWVNAIQKQIEICSENNFMHLAELIISEEELVRSCKI